MQRKTYKITCISTALSPLTHNRGSEGNETIINTEPVAQPDGSIATVPVLSGNSLRNRMVRSSGAGYLVDAYGLRGILSVEQCRYLFAGGQLTQKSASESLTRVARIWRLFPLLRILGGCLPDMIVPGNLICERGTLICAENRHLMRDLIDDAPLHSGWHYIGRYQYTRVDPIKSNAESVSAAPALISDKSAQMIYSGQTIMAGAGFLHGFYLPDAQTVELGALLHSIRLWENAGGIIGGMGGRGHGRLRTKWAISPDIDAEAAIAEYISHVEAVKDEAVAALKDEFTPKAEGEKKARGKKAKAAPANEEDEI